MSPRRRWFPASLVAVLLWVIGALFTATPAYALPTVEVRDTCVETVGDKLVRLSAPGETGAPVLLVHGWLSTSVDPATATGRRIATSPFSRQVSWADGDGRPASDTDSLVQRLDALPGTVVYGFDYSAQSSAWVSDSGVTTQLTEAIDCLAENTGARVDVVAHSMGGLALRAALGARPDLVERLGQVITVGTPNLGSDAANLLDGAVATAQTMLTGAPMIANLVLRGFVQECVQELDEDARSGCDIAPWLRTLVANASGGAQALRAGSAEIDALPGWPAPLEVHAIAGSAALQVKIGDLVPPALGVAAAVARSFGIETPVLIKADMLIGDGLVSQPSALAGADTSFVTQCTTPVDVSNVVGLRDTASILTREGAFTGACAHDALFENQAVVDDIVDVIDRPGRGGPRA
jgi:pimeloyl-ACP methyl ester carboxylesterase